jgi:hypothetical protein
MGNDVRKALGLLLALMAAVAGGGRPALAGDSKGETLDAARGLVTRAGLDCVVVDANLIAPAPPAQGGRRRGGGGMGRGGIGAGGGPFPLASDESQVDGMSGGGPEGGGMPRPEIDAEGAPSSRDRSAPLGYEVACRGGLGFVILNPAQRRGSDKRRHTSDAQEDTPIAPAPDYLNCLEADTAAERLGSTLRCHLKANRERVEPMQALVSRAGVDCAVSRVRGLGHTETRSFFELACIKGVRGGPPKLSDTGLVFVTSRTVSAAGASAAFPCVDTQANPNLRCSLTNVGPIVEALHRSVARFEPDCVASAQRLAGLSRNGGKVFEIACRNGSSYMLRVADDGSADPPVPCSDPAVAGQCRLAKTPPNS